ncbi:Tubulinyl-Tyr carboxypeptidase 2 [Physocladia obscura]|uniref:Tubulinyl-Tyr carboxypeptidase 2 n=1 Tax=Physocladia obscura TaxID=109957 RepID=A0AAD5XKE0_9FUNG|nr:Tubulinyl-Tyr carboxypeptidase 2 [Physocladia obscura]
MHRKHFPENFESFYQETWSHLSEKMFTSCVKDSEQADKRLQEDSGTPKKTVAASGAKEDIVDLNSGVYLHKDKEIKQITAIAKSVQFLTNTIQGSNYIPVQFTTIPKVPLVPDLVDSNNIGVEQRVLEIRLEQQTPDETCTRDLYIWASDKHLDKFGALGLSRRNDLMYKPIEFETIEQLVEEYRLSYIRNMHKLLKVKIGNLIVHEHENSIECFPWPVDAKLAKDFEIIPNLAKDMEHLVSLTEQERASELAVICREDEALYTDDIPERDQHSHSLAHLLAVLPAILPFRPSDVHPIFRRDVQIYG